MTVVCSRINPLSHITIPAARGAYREHVVVIATVFGTDIHPYLNRTAERPLLPHTGRSGVMV
jgi:hypothetical protein